MATKLIIVEGLSGAEKSTTAQRCGIFLKLKELILNIIQKET